MARLKESLKLIPCPMVNLGRPRAPEQQGMLANGHVAVHGWPRNVCFADTSAVQAKVALLFMLMVLKYDQALPSEAGSFPGRGGLTC